MGDIWFFFFKQKTAYEIYQCDWSSDVCSSDLYSETYFDQPPLSLLEIPHALDRAIEFHSLSKTFNMTGWRLGFAAGNASLIAALAQVKGNCDSGQFIAVQKAAAAALDDDESPRRTREKYHRRLVKLVEVLRRCGFDCRVPGGTYFLYTASPKGVDGGPGFDSAEQASQYLITEHSISTVPWDDAGAFLRFSVTYVAQNEAAEDALMAETKNRLESAKFAF